jgi:hypothetical protein
VRAQLRTLFAEATEAIRAAFALRTNGAWGFDIPIALLSGEKR